MCYYIHTKTVRRLHDFWHESLDNLVKRLSYHLHKLSVSLSWTYEIIINPVNRRSKKYITIQTDQLRGVIHITSYCSYSLNILTSCIEVRILRISCREHMIEQI